LIIWLEILVVSGDLSFIFSLTELTWRSGPPLPEELYQLTSVQLDDGFMVIGGVDGKDLVSRNSVHTIDSNYNWISNKNGFELGRDYIIGVKVPNDFLNC